MISTAKSPHKLEFDRGGPAFSVQGTERQVKDEKQLI